MQVLMGALIAQAHRCLNMRSPSAKALVVAVGLFILGSMLMRSNYEVRQVLEPGAVAGKQPVFQEPWGDDVANLVPGSGSRVEVQAEGQAEEAGSGTISKSASKPIMAPAKNVSTTCTYDMDRLRTWQTRYGLQKTLEYTRRHVKFSRQDVERKSLTILDQKLVPEAAKVMDVEKDYPAEGCQPPLLVPVPKSPFTGAANGSDFIFGVSTTYQRFVDEGTSPIREWMHWLTDGKGKSNGGKLILMLVGASAAELEEAHRRLAEVGVDADLYEADGGTEMAVRYLSLVPTMYNHASRMSRRWMVLCDDDTFFPAFGALVRRMAAFNHSRPMYIGAFSEDMVQVERHGPQAFGGAGVFLSMPMAEVVNRHSDECRSPTKVNEANSGWGPQGDILLRKCIYEHSEILLTILNDLWQLDMTGDMAGFYESGIRPLSLHHYRGGMWHMAKPLEAVRLASICGEDCSYMRFQTADDYIIAAGYSVAHYPRGIDVDLDQFERTFVALPEDKGWNLDHRFGPQRRPLHNTGRKVAWTMEEAVLNEDGSVTQLYVRRADDGRWKVDDRPMMPTDGIIELVWTP